ncbi:hypothetical protein DAPPUDRAFT_339226 [Daphnia pulex]|uniref:Uncharacterized protein n=1 Tax=Daphnia pulex TaxID=6669 RepID=E9I3C9_DAPPU|nr:hypothetical protein DAPPUDRAFT_339226 [Daphnia pulex]|eukprot:EFX61501.1 hypothetical protein DAPPUDRAFT_339226 [Daphnia pulex]
MKKSPIMVLRARVGKEDWMLVIIARLRNAVVTFVLPISLVIEEAQKLTIREGMSYFEKICLRGNVGPCRDRAWAFERYPGKELRGTEERVIP